MFDKLGVAGAFGLLVLVAGIVVIALESLVIAGGIALVLAGLGLVVFGMLKNLLRTMGMGGGLV